MVLVHVFANSFTGINLQLCHIDSSPKSPSHLPRIVRHPDTPSSQSPTKNLGPEISEDPILPNTGRWLTEGVTVVMNASNCSMLVATCLVCQVAVLFVVMAHVMLELA